LEKKWLEGSKGPTSFPAGRHPLGKFLATLLAGSIFFDHIKIYLYSKDEFKPMRDSLNVSFIIKGN
jgi:hypothetical protein